MSKLISERSKSDPSGALYAPEAVAGMRGGIATSTDQQRVSATGQIRMRRELACGHNTE
ncbi:hypothetical protein [Gymnodinialimonas hymeniacidonis]|uniref:hypothetical protein n=1 Tax=Gymnodinialimonas hymeniacidonis TaxID=3126508 RepID=UPI0034C62E67